MDDGFALKPEAEHKCFHNSINSFQNCSSFSHLTLIDFTVQYIVRA